MNVRDEHTRSLWMDVSVADAPALSGTLSTDVVVVGSGIAGLSVAYELASHGRSVVVLDRGGIGSGMTARTTAHLATALDDGYDALVRVRGLDCAQRYYQSVAAAIDRAKAIQSAEHIDCDFQRVDGYWVQAPETATSELDAELIAVASSEFLLKTASSQPRSMPRARCVRCALPARHACTRANISPVWRTH